MGKATSLIVVVGFGQNPFGPGRRPLPDRIRRLLGQGLPGQLEAMLRHPLPLTATARGSPAHQRKRMESPESTK